MREYCEGFWLCVGDVYMLGAVSDRTLCNHLGVDRGNFRRQMARIAQYGFINKYRNARLPELKKRALMLWRIQGETPGGAESCQKAEAEIKALQTSYDIRLLQALRHKYL